MLFYFILVPGGAWRCLVLVVIGIGVGVHKRTRIQNNGRILYLLLIYLIRLLINICYTYYDICISYILSKTLISYLLSNMINDY